MQNGGEEKVVLIAAADHLFALPLRTVRRVLSAVAVTPLGGDYPPELSTVNMHGDTVPVVDLRRHVGLPPRPMALTDCFVVVKSTSGPVAIQVDAVAGVAGLDDSGWVGDAKRIEDPQTLLSEDLLQAIRGLTAREVTL